MSVRNMGTSLPYAVASILNQTYIDLELVVVDDASTDSTIQHLSYFKSLDPRVRVITNSKNLGYPASLNIGWRSTRSEFIAILDADDAAMPERIEKQLLFLRQNREVAVVGSAAEFVDENGTTLGIRLRPATHEELIPIMYKESPFFHPSVMMRRQFLETLSGYDESLKRSQDADLWLRGYRHFRYANLQEPLLRYRFSSRPSWSSVAYGSYVRARAGFRDQSRLKGLWYTVRFAAAGVLAKLRIRPRLPR